MFAWSTCQAVYIHQHQIAGKVWGHFTLSRFKFDQNLCAHVTVDVHVTLIICSHLMHLYCIQLYTHNFLYQFIIYSPSRYTLARATATPQAWLTVRLYSFGRRHFTSRCRYSSLRGLFSVSRRGLSWRTNNIWRPAYLAGIDLWLEEKKFNFSEHYRVGHCINVFVLLGISSIRSDASGV